MFGHLVNLNFGYIGFIVSIVLVCLGDKLLWCGIFVYCLCIDTGTRRAFHRVATGPTGSSSTTMASHPPLRAARSPVRSPWRKWRRDELDELDFLFLLARRRASFRARVGVGGVAFDTSGVSDAVWF